MGASRHSAAVADGGDEVAHGVRDLLGRAEGHGGLGADAAPERELVAEEFLHEEVHVVFLIVVAPGAAAELVEQGGGEDEVEADFSGCWRRRARRMFSRLVIGIVRS